eukprot:5265949-Pyramimonas_sp.AAC.1
MLRESLGAVGGLAVAGATRILSMLNGSALGGEQKHAIAGIVNSKVTLSGRPRSAGLPDRQKTQDCVTWYNYPAQELRLNF